MKSETNYGRQLNELFCYHWERPNCVGGKTAASQLLDYSRHFIDAHKSRHWAQFLHFVDSREDSMTLASLLDDPLTAFFEEVGELKNTAIVLVSNNGLDYGPYFQLPDGEAERAMPILFTRFPDRYKVTASENDPITPFDVYRTLLELSGVSLASRTNEELPGLSLFSTSPRAE